MISSLAGRPLVTAPLAQLCSIRNDLTPHPCHLLPFNINRWRLYWVVFAGEQNLSFLAGFCQSGSPGTSSRLLPTQTRRPLPAHLQGALSAGPLPCTSAELCAPELNLGPQGFSCSRPERKLVRLAEIRLDSTRCSAPQNLQGWLVERSGRLTQHSCSPFLKALYAGMNSFSHGDLKALLTKWVTFLGIFIRLVSFCHARQLFWNFRFDIKATKEVGNYLEHCGILAFEL